MAEARPLFTEDVATVGRFAFEGEVGGSGRTDKFGEPEATYDTVRIPTTFTFGVARKMDLGVTFQYLGQSIEMGSARLSGSQTAMIAPQLKFRFNDTLGLMTIWHRRIRENSAENLPIGRGDDIEVQALFKVPVAWPIHFNVGQVFREAYKSRFGIQGGPVNSVYPGDIFMARTAVEIPIGKGFHILNEWLYYHTDQKKFNNTPVRGSEGDAVDAVVGLTWSAYNWNIGVAAAFGMGNESHTSFDLERGAGDFMYKMNLAYRLAAKKPTL